MRRLFALILILSLWLGFTPVASAAENVAGLVPCSESPAFQQRAQRARPTTDAASAQARFERYSQALCGPEGLPHLVVDGRLDRAGDFIIPGILFLYIAGWIGWVGRAYIIAIKKEADPAAKEIQIDVPLALKYMLTGFTWPLAAIKEFTTGELYARDDEVTVSPR